MSSPDSVLAQVFCSVTDRCNLSCSMCMRKHLYYGWKDIDPAILQRVYDKAPELRFVGLQQFGEPYLYAGLFEVIGTLKALMPEGSTVALSTNATVLDSRLAVKTVQSGLDLLTFSLDGATKETHEMVRKGSDFGKVIGNIKWQAQYVKETGKPHPQLKMNYVIVRENISEIPQFIGLAKECGVPTVHFNYEMSTYMDLITEELEQAFDDARRRAEELNVTAAFPPLRPVDPEDESCPFTETAILLNSGEVIPCCHGARPDALRHPDRMLVFGNVRDRSLDEIWASEPYAAFRRKVLTRDWPAFCDDCPYRSQMCL